MACYGHSWELLGENPKAGRMPRPDRGEVPAIKGDDEIGVQPFGQGNHRGVGPTDWEIPILLDQLSDARPVCSMRRLYFVA